MSDCDVTLHALNIYPVKSCAGIAVREAPIVETGLDLDRAWMVVDEHGVFVSQRDTPRLQLVRPTLGLSDVVLRAPGMLPLHLRTDAAEGRCTVRVWNDEVTAYDMGDLAARWFSDFLGRRLRLARFDPEHPRVSNRRWTGEVEALTAFADAFALLVVSTASLAELNRRLAARGLPPVTMERFRPNLVLDGLDPHGEDYLDEIVLETGDGPVRLRVVKPCGRCTVPNVDPATGEAGHEPGDTLAGYRADPRLDGAVTFGMNAVVLDGVGHTLKVGARGTATLRF